MQFVSLTKICSYLCVIWNHLNSNAMQNHRSLFIYICICMHIEYIWSIHPSSHTKHVFCRYSILYRMFTFQCRSQFNTETKARTWKNCTVSDDWIERKSSIVTRNSSSNLLIYHVRQFNFSIPIFLPSFCPL